MSQIFIHGFGAVSPAGWGVPPLREAIWSNLEMPTKDLPRPGWSSGLRVRQVPTPSPRPAFLAHTRLRRTSAISQYMVAAALEALGDDATLVTNGSLRLGIILCAMSGCVNYSRRFYDEVLRDPGTASPLVFPETVFNAPSSHLAALLGSTAINYTLVGDPGTFLQGLALAADWLATEQVDGCLVMGAEEIDWLTADAFRLFTRQIILSDGAGALYVRRDQPADVDVELRAITNSHLFAGSASRARAAEKVRDELSPGTPHGLLCDGTQNISKLDAPETLAWKDWPGARVSPKKILGEGLMAAAALQCVVAADALARGAYADAFVSVAGCNQQVIGARFARSHSAP